MKRILLAINSASHQIFQNDTKALVEGYAKIIEKNHLNIEVVTFCGSAENKDSYIENIVLQDTEKEVGKIVFDFIEKYSNLKEYDVFIKSNTNTVLNLSLIQAFCDSSYFDENIMYSCAGFRTLGEIEVKFPAGMFLMSGVKTWQKIIDNKDSILKYANEYFANEKTKRDLYKTDEDAKTHLLWTGYSDEFLIGIGLKLNNLHINFINSSTCSKSKQELFYGISTAIDTSLVSINCKLDYEDISLKLNSLEENFRIQYEHYFITALCKIFELYNFKLADIEELSKKIYIYS